MFLVQEPQETPTIYIEMCKTIVSKIVSKLPSAWLLSYLVFFRVANDELQVATNYKSSKYLKSFIASENSHSTQSPKHIRGLLFAARTSYINDIAPFIFTSEEAFNEEFLRRNITVIGPYDMEKRKFIYNLLVLNEKRLE